MHDTTEKMDFFQHQAFLTARVPEPSSLLLLCGGLLGLAGIGRKRTK